MGLSQENELAVLRFSYSAAACAVAGAAGFCTLVTGCCHISILLSGVYAGAVPMLYLLCNKVNDKDGIGKLS